MLSTYQILLKYKTFKGKKKSNKKDRESDIEKSIKRGSIFLDKLPKPHNLDYYDKNILESQIKKNLITLIGKYNDGKAEEEQILESQALKNIDDIKKLYKFSQSQKFYAITILLNYIITFFSMFQKYSKFMEGVKYLILILQYSLPEYEINPFIMLSKDAALRSNSKNYLIQNLYHSRDYIIEYIFRAMDLTVDKKISKKFSFKKIQEIYELIIFSKKLVSILPNINEVLSSKERKTILLYKNSILFQNKDIELNKGTIQTFYKGFIDNSLKEIVASSSDIYLSNVIQKRSKYEIQRHVNVGDPALVWNEFLPLLESDTIVLSPLETTVIIPDLEINQLKEILYKLSNNYIYYLNKIIDLQNNDNGSYQKYTSSKAFGNINMNFRDYFNIENFESGALEYPISVNLEEDEGVEKEKFKKYLEEISKIINYMRDIKVNLNKKTSNTLPTYTFTNSNIKVRNLQEQVEFSKLSVGKPRKYYLDRLQLLHTTYYIELHHLNPEDTTNLNKKRVFQSVKNPQYNIIQEVLKAQVMTDDTNFNLIDKYRELIGSNTNILSDIILDTEGVSEDEKLIFFSEKSEGTYFIDVLDTKVKEIIEYRIDLKYSNEDEYDIDALKRIINTIENKIHNTVLGKKETSSKIDEELDFKTHYVDVINKMNLFEPSSSVTPGVIVLKEIFKDDFDNIKLKWRESDTITFIMSASEINEVIISKIEKKNIKIFTNLNNLYDSEKNDLKLTDFFMEKNREIDSDLNILLDTNDFREILDLEKGFFSRKYETDEKENILRIVVYLLRFLISTILVIYNEYKNNILYNQCNPDTTLQFMTSLDNDDKYEISNLYNKRYSKVCELETKIPVTKKALHKDFTDICRNILISVDLLDTNLLNTKQASLLVIDFISKILYLSTSIMTNQHYVVVTSIFFEEVASIFETFKTNEYDIQNYIKIKKTRGNQIRKKQFDSKTREDQMSHKLYRRFGLGNMLDLDEDKPENTEEEGEEEVENEEAGVGYDTGDPEVDV